MREPVVSGLDPGAVDQHLGVGSQSGKRATEVAVDLHKKDQGGGSAQHKGSVRTSQPAATGSILGVPKFLSIKFDVAVI